MGTELINSWIPSQIKIYELLKIFYWTWYAKTSLTYIISTINSQNRPKQLSLTTFYRWEIQGSESGNSEMSSGLVSVLTCFLHQSTFWTVTQFHITSYHISPSLTLTHTHANVHTSKITGNVLSFPRIFL